MKVEFDTKREIVNQSSPPKTSPPSTSFQKKFGNIPVCESLGMYFN